VVYVCQGGAFEIFDTTTDALAVQSPTPTIIVGQSFDVKLVDPPNLTGAINYREGSSLNW